MARWEKLVARMVADRKGRSYTYGDCVRILTHLGFELAPNSGTSHRKWRRHIGDSADPNKQRLIVVGLVEAGSGALKPEYIKHMIDTLEEAGLVPLEAM